MKDVPLDAPLLNYLIDGKVPEVAEERQRVEKAAQFIEFKGGKLVLTNDKGEVIVPPIRDRGKIIEEVAAAIGLTSSPRLYNLIRETYWWSGMRADCIKYCSTTTAV